jgi:hypothetical protein
VDGDSPSTINGTGFPNQFFCDSWVVGGRTSDWKEELGRFLKPFLVMRASEPPMKQRRWVRSFRTTCVISEIPPSRSSISLVIQIYMICHAVNKEKGSIRARPLKIGFTGNAFLRRGPPYEVEGFQRAHWLGPARHLQNGNQRIALSPSFAVKCPARRVGTKKGVAVV